MRNIAAVTLLLAAACGSSSGTKPAATIAPPDPQIAGLQASMTELLERLDVMNDRISRLEKASEERGAQAPPPVQPPPQRATRTGEAPVLHNTPLRAASIADMYRNAIVLFGKNRYADARAAFQQVYDADVSGELADNALFWIGETYFAAADYNNAIRYYKRVSDEYGDQNKAPDAMYKLALSYEKTSDLAQARTTLQEVIARYPYSAPASSAKTELNRIKY
jgi:tol-pal system protein YbgF